MRPPVRRLLVAASLLCSFSTYAQMGPTSPQIPTRSLLSEMTQAEHGTAAYIHTYFSTGNGFFLAAEDEVITARHTVLTPTGQLVHDVGVGLPQLPLNNILEARSVPVAQDPTHDLVLLRVTSGIPLARPALKENEAPESHLAPSLPCEAHHSEQRPQQPSETRLHRELQPRHAQQHSQPKLISHEQTVAQVPTQARVPLHIVQDGPVHSVHVVQNKSTADPLRIVWDGPVVHTPRRN